MLQADTPHVAHKLNVLHARTILNKRDCCLYSCKHTHTHKEKERLNRTQPPLMAAVTFPHFISRVHVPHRPNVS